MISKLVTKINRRTKIERLIYLYRLRVYSFFHWPFPKLINGDLLESIDELGVKLLTLFGQQFKKPDNETCPKCQVFFFMQMIWAMTNILTAKLKLYLNIEKN